MHCINENGEIYTWGIDKMQYGYNNNNKKK